ncbi:glycosyltransferase involved in cell wall biosynthesis [Actinoplanes octamycinicus]|uniref:Glycosyltransferase involved in cell wall biosynthesis n=1 Tax=Actinoplanes octamycinicus TaxID=135948 RepID=A0A7W7GXM8_9ACTN|nr:glycosyltransferase [Actinoplanes octamycinicus]MBB4740166.1 glycosyltransferase involved in cell wall biosynthesis [Actinoplanes octamycinicus]GIE59563.1 glycosyl transferase family 1 [Actinoplanes octamycinicus]
MSTERRVAIWRSAMLPGSETFIRHQGDALSRWTPAYVGATRIDSALSRPDDVIAFPDRRGFLRLRLTGTSPRLHKTLLSVRPHLVHAHFGGDGWLVSQTAARLGVPLVVTVHGHDVTRQPASSGAKGVRYRRNLQAVFDRATLVLAVSDVIREQAVRWGADPAKVRVHHIGVPVPAAVPIVPKRWDVVFVGRFVAKKGVDDLLAALARIERPRPRALFIGDGELMPAMRARAEQLRVDATFVGSASPAAVTRHLSESRILACPSKTAPDGDTEGLPTTVMEAGALGLPVAATRHSGIPEAVVDGETGLLTAEADPVGLAASLTRLLGDAELRHRLGAQARRRIGTHFDLVEQTRRLEHLYDEATTGTAVAGRR